jgi:methionyl-tRNA formyltransferase
MKIIFFGTPDYVVPIVEALHKEYNIRAKERQFIAVVTQPPKPVGRSKIVERSPVDNWAYKHKIDVIFLDTPGWDQSQIPEADLGVVASYGKIIPDEIIKKFSQGIINIHPSLLPEFRGASPIQAQIVTGTDPIGVSFIKMDEKMDHGPIISQFKDHLEPDDTFETVRTRLFERSAEVLIEMLPAFLSHKIKIKDQDHTKATFTTLLEKDHAFILWEDIKDAIAGNITWHKLPYGFIKDMDYIVTPQNIERFTRAMQPWPTAWTTITINNQEMRLKILKAHIENEKLVLDEVQLEGKNPVTWEQFNEGYKLD